MARVDMVSRLSVDYSTKSSTMDFVSTNVPTDEYFTLSRQHGLSLLSSIQGALLIGIMNDAGMLKDFLSLLSSAVSYISEKIDGDDEHLLQDILYLSEQIEAIADNLTKPNAIRILCYGASLLAISIAEKLLRLLYTELVKDEIYVPTNKATLGELLNENNQQIVDIFGDVHIKCLTYFLIQTSDNKIGYNLRNSLAHWNNISSDSMNLRFFSTCLWLFMDIMNTIFWHFIKIDEGF